MNYLKYTWISLQIFVLKFFIKIETLYNNYKKQSLKRFVNYQVLASYNYNVEVAKLLLKNN